jgi:hypothetical protein
VAALDAPSAVKPTGRVLTEILGADVAMTSREVGADEDAVAEPSVSDTEADEMEEHLRGLGYLE